MWLSEPFKYLLTYLKFQLKLKVPGSAKGPHTDNYSTRAFASPAYSSSIRVCSWLAVDGGSFVRIYLQLFMYLLPLPLQLTLSVCGVTRNQYVRVPSHKRITVTRIEWEYKSDLGASSYALSIYYLSLLLNVTFDGHFQLLNLTHGLL